MIGFEQIVVSIVRRLGHEVCNDEDDLTSTINSLSSIGLWKKRRIRFMNQPHVSSFGKMIELPVK
jgi:hypothetical protein